MTYLAKAVRTVEHVVGRSPSDVAMQREGLQEVNGYRFQSEVSGSIRCIVQRIGSVRKEG